MHGIGKLLLHADIWKCTKHLYKVEYLDKQTVQRNNVDLDALSVGMIYQNCPTSNNVSQTIKDYRFPSNKRSKEALLVDNVSNKFQRNDDMFDVEL